MQSIIQLINLDKVYWWWRDDVVPLDNYIFDFILGKYAECKTLTQLLFDTDSGFLKSLEWKGQMIASSTIEVHEFRTTEYRDNTRQYHAMILAQMTSDEDRIKHIKENTQTNSQ